MMGMESKPDFRSLVENLLKGSDLFQTIQMRATLGGEWTDDEKKQLSEDRTAVLEAIENNDLSHFIETRFGSRPNNNVLDAIHCLTSIYDETKKENPDQDFIEETTEQLKGYL